MAIITKTTKNQILDASSTSFPSSLQVICKTSFEVSRDSNFYYGYVLNSTCELKSNGLKAELSEGMYFSLNAPFAFIAHGTVILIKKFNYKGLNNIGGPVEPTGRLTYINGCTSTLLLSPAKLGDPCLNLLHFPPNIIQSEHTHPSVRLGAIISGEGYCHLKNEKVKLQKDDCFYLFEEEAHYFSSGPEGMNVLAYHPDTDWGPTDEVHPMLNRTFLTNG